MPGVLTRYVLENPYPLGVLLLALALGLLWTAVRGEQRQRLPLAGGLAGAGVVVLLVGTFVITSGERAAALTLTLVDAAVTADIQRARSLFADDATMSFGRSSNPSHGRVEIDRRVDRLQDRYRVASNRIMSLEAETKSRERAVVVLACSTQLEQGFGPIITRWELEVERQPDGTWKIAHVTWESLNGQTPSTKY